MAVALARSFTLQKEKLKRTRDDLWSQLSKSTHSSSPLSGNSTTSAGRASSMSPSPTYKSIPSPSSGVCLLHLNLFLPEELGVSDSGVFFISCRREWLFPTARAVAKGAILLGRGKSLACGGPPFCSDICAQVDDIFKAVDAWHKAEVNCTGKLADLEVPFALDSFLTPTPAPPISSVIAYAHKASELLQA